MTELKPFKGKLLPCPFCGEVPKIEKTYGQTISGAKHSKPYYVIVHLEKGLSIRISAETKNGLINKWNTRSDFKERNRPQKAVCEHQWRYNAGVPEIPLTCIKCGFEPRPEEVWKQPEKKAVGDWEKEFDFEFDGIYEKNVKEHVKSFIRSKFHPSENVEELVGALEFYADPENYFAIGFFPDKPCGDFINDFSDTGELGERPGKRAREALKNFKKGKESSYGGHVG